MPYFDRVDGLKRNVMKTKEYVLKYKLNESDKFDHTEFVSDLTIDFLSLLEVGKATSNLKGFNNAVNAIRMKFDAVNNKTRGCIPEKLWKYFFATVIVKMRDNLFPKEMRLIKEQKEKRKRAYENRQNWYNQEFNFFDESFFYSILADMLKVKKPLEAFEILGLPLEANQEDVKLKYRELCFLYHPDKGGKQEQFIKITEAKNKCLSYLMKN